MIRNASDAGSLNEDGEIVGSVFLVKHSESTAKLRLLLVEPRARGKRPRHAVGRRVRAICADRRLSEDHALDQPRACTQPVRSMRRLAFGWSRRNLTTVFGEGLIGQTWELVL